MAKKDWKKEGEELKKVVAAAKKKPQNFALVELKEGMSLCAHPLNPVGKLAIEAKKADGAKKANCVTGKLKVNGKQFVFDCLEDKLPGGIEIKFKQYLKKVDHGAFKAAFNLPEAEQKDAKKADEEEAAPQPRRPAAPEPEPEAETQAAAQAEAPQSEEAASDENAEEQKETGSGKQLSAEQLTANFEHISEIFELSYDGMDEKQAKDLQGVLKSIGDALKNGDLTGAQSMMNKLGLLTGVTPASPKQPITLAAPKQKGGDMDPAELKKKKKDLTNDLKDLKPDLQKATVQSDPAGQKELQTLIKQFQKQFKANEVGDAEESFAELKTKVEEFLEAQQQAADEAESAQPSGPEQGNGAAAPEAASGGPGEDAPPGLSPERKKARADELAGLQKELDDFLASL